MATQNGKLFELADACRRYRKDKAQDTRVGKHKKKKHQVKARHFDMEKPISLSYSLDMYPQTLRDAYLHRDPAAQLSFIDDSSSEAFYVEPFDTEETEDVAFEETADEEMLDRVVKVDDEKEEEPPEKKAGDERRAAEEDHVKPVPADGNGLVAEKPVSEERREVADTPLKGKREEQPVPEEEHKHEKQDSAPYEVSDEEFAKDIGAILQGKKVYDESQKKAVTPGEAKPAARQPKKGSEENPLAEQKPKEDADLGIDKNEHKIFEKISQSMRYANSYNLGAIAMEERFDQMNRELEEEEVKTILNEKGKDIEDAKVQEEQQPSDKKQLSPDVLPGQKYPPDRPLDPSNGGRETDVSQIQQGDLIISASPEGKAIAGAYMGEGKVLTGDETGLQEKQLSIAPTKGKPVVVLRHDSLSGETATRLIGALPKNEADGLVHVSIPAVSLHPSVCEAAGSDKDACLAFSGKIQLGTADNESFLCPAAIAKAYEESGLKFTTGEIPGPPDQGPANEKHNGTLKYFGHLNI